MTSTPRGAAPAPVTRHDTGAVAGWGPIVAVALAVFLLLLQTTVVSVALPAIGKDLRAGPTALQWVVDGYALTMAALQLVGGSAGDRFGHRTVFVAGIGLFTLAALVGGSAPTTGTLIAAVCAQGAGGALMFSTSLALIARYYRGSARGTAFAVRGTVAGVAAAAGPLLGGLVTTGLGWRWVFFLNVPVAAVAVAVALASLRAEPAPDRSRRLDVPGALCLSLTLLLVVYALLRGNEDGWASARIVGLFVAAGLGLLAFVAVERRRRDPMLDLGLFRRPRFTGAQLAALAAQGSLFPLYVYLSLYLQGPQGFTALGTGLRLLPVTVPILVVGAAVGTLMDRFPVHRLIGLGLAVIGAGLLALHALTPASGWTALLPGFVVTGVGVGLTLPPLGALAVSVVEPERVGMASGVNNTFQQIGFSTGLAVYGAVFAHHLTTAARHGVPPSHAYPDALDPLFTIAAVIALTGSAAVLTLNRRPSSR